MTQLRRLVLFPGILLLPSLLLGQVLEAGFTGGVSLLKNNELVPGQAKLTDGFRLGGRLTINTHRFLGHEAGYAYNRTNLDIEGQEYGMAIHQGFYNLLLYAVPEGSPVRFFVTGGGHFANFVPPGASASYGQGYTKFGVNYGGGVKARAGSKFMVRFDFRQYHTPKPDFFQTAPSGWLRQVEVSAGFGFVM